MSLVKVAASRPVIPWTRTLVFSSAKIANLFSFLFYAELFAFAGLSAAKAKKFSLRAQRLDRSGR
jgi:hypothetical protein